MAEGRETRSPAGGRGVGAWLDGAGLSLAFLSLLALGLHKIADFDLWWQLATGAWILEHGLPRIDPFSYGFPERRWIELRWLYYLGIHGLSRAFGLNALILAKLCVLFATTLVLLRLLRSPWSFATNAALLALLCLLFPRFGVRPELMSFLWISLVLLCLDRFKRGGSPRWLLAIPPLQVLWNNTHTLGVLGPVLLWSSAVCELAAARAATRFPLLARDPLPIRGARLRWLAGTAAAATLAGLATPYGLAGFLYPITLMRESGGELSLMIAELHSPLYHAGFHFHFASYVLVVALSGASFLLLPERLVLTRLVWWLGFLWVSLLSQRNISLFGIVAVLVAMANLRDRLDAGTGGGGQLPNAARLAVVAAGLALSWSAVTDRFWRWQDLPQSFGFGVLETSVPIHAMAFVHEQGLPRPVMADLASGGYLLWLDGAKSVYFDGRLEVYGVANLVRGIQSQEDGAAFLGLLRQHRIRTAVLRHPPLRNAIAALESRPDWVPVYFDSAFVVYVLRDEETRGRVDALAIDWEHPVRREAAPPAFATPPDWLAGFFPRVPDSSGRAHEGYLLLLVGSLERSREAFAEAVEQRPDDTWSRIHLAILEHALGRREAASRELARIDRSLLESADVLALRAHLARRQGQPEEAFEFLRRAVAAGDRSPARTRELELLARELPDAAAARAALEELAAGPAAP